MRSVRVLALMVVGCLCFASQAVAKKVPYGGQNTYANGNIFTFGFVKTKRGVANFSSGTTAPRRAASFPPLSSSPTEQR